MYKVIPEVIIPAYFPARDPLRGVAAAGAEQNEDVRLSVDRGEI